jgi:hypothetical protein
MGVACLRAEFVGQLLALVVEQISDHHVAATPDYVACERCAETPRATGDHDNLSRKLP